MCWSLLPPAISTLQPVSSIPNCLTPAATSRSAISANKARSSGVTSCVLEILWSPRLMLQSVILLFDQILEEEEQCYASGGLTGPYVLCILCTCCMLSDPTLIALLVKHILSLQSKGFGVWVGGWAVTSVGLTTNVSQLWFECRRMTFWFCLLCWFYSFICLVTSFFLV